MELESTEVLKRRNKRYLPGPPPLSSHGFSIFTRFSLAFHSSKSFLSGWSNSFRPLCPSIPSILSIFSLEKNCMDKLGTSRKNFVAPLWRPFDFSFLISERTSPSFDELFYLFLLDYIKNVCSLIEFFCIALNFLVQEIIILLNCSFWNV